MSEVKVTTGGMDYVDKAGELLFQTFGTNPPMNFVLGGMSAEKKRQFSPEYFRILMRAAALNNAIIEEADDWSALCVLVPPDSHVENPATLVQAGFLSLLWNIGAKGCWRLFVDFVPVCDAAKERAINNHEKHFYIMFGATDRNKRRKGLMQYLLKRCQETARREGLPIWAECSTIAARDLVASQGFKLTEEIIVGKGKADVNGNLVAGGEGLKLWGMLWRPEGHSSEY
ncbi:hypothetical protein FGADI_6690 [Fusarium gaditjirri]|uniref:N-acetyltransferase domain-containing protein n=1 Tax=Fusarium gaditjirri TaxID=282569 RepID=A0A8H4WWK1_9HYPO|nr:hypothetical protein FGADI_6690 [Fusarium gaditjirri]